MPASPSNGSPKPAGGKPGAKPPAKKKASSGRGSAIWIVLVVAAVVLVAGVVAIISSTSKDDDPASANLVQSQPVTITGTPLAEYPDQGSGEADPTIGTTPPTIEGLSFSGAPVKIVPGSSGKPTVIAVVTHWCPHCQAEVPRIVNLHNDGKIPDGVDIVTVSTSVKEENGNYPPSDWFAKTAWPYPVLADSASNEASTALGTKYFPYLIFLDKDGKVVARTTGEIPEDELATMFQQLADGTLTNGTSGGASSGTGGPTTTAAGATTTKG